MINPKRGEAAPLLPSQTGKVLSYRVAVKQIAKAVLELAETGELSKFSKQYLEECAKVKRG